MSAEALIIKSSVPMSGCKSQVGIVFGMKAELPLTLEQRTNSIADWWT